METIENFFKNRISFNMKKSYIDDYLIYGFSDPHDKFKYSSKIRNAQSLNIKATFDLIEKLTPLFKYISSNIERFIKEMKNIIQIVIFRFRFVEFTCNEVQNNYIDNEWYTM